MTQEILIERAGMDRRTYQRIEAGTVDPPFGALALIAHGLGITVSELVDLPSSSAASSTHANDTT